MQGVQLKQVDLDYRNHLQAWLTFAAKAEKKAGKGKTRPVYSKFKRFYDYDKELAKVKENKGNKGKFAGIGKFLKERE